MTLIVLMRMIPINSSLICMALAGMSGSIFFAFARILRGRGHSWLPWDRLPLSLREELQTLLAIGSVVPFGHTASMR